MYCLNYLSSLSHLSAAVKLFVWLYVVLFLRKRLFVILLSLQLHKYSIGRIRRLVKRADKTTVKITSEGMWVRETIDFPA